MRVDGGEPSQCTGLVDAPFPGSGAGRACAWRHPFHALPPNGLRRLAGGDTLVIGSGSYMIGPGAPGAGACAPANCGLAPIPSGQAGAPTRILGSATHPPRLWGSGGVTRLLSLEGSSHVEVGYLELTDQSDCVHEHSHLAARCGAVGTGAWGKHGVYARASSNVWLHDLDIHGLAHTGLWAGGLAGWTLDRVRLHRNGRAGWDANVGMGSSNSGAIILRRMEIAWNGCGEMWQSGVAWACWGQQSGGYGDGLGTTTSGGRWLIEDSIVHHNTQDGLDLRFLDGADTTHATIRRVKVSANAGNQVKVRGNALVENSVLVGNCGWFINRHRMLPADICRADGTTLLLVFTPNDRIAVRHNTIAGEGYSLVGTTEGDASGRASLRNNVLVGHARFLHANERSRVRAGTSPAFVGFAGNLVWTVQGNACPPSSICGQDPQLADMRVASFDARPLPGSPVLDRVIPLPDVRTDFLRGARPHGAASDIGAYEFRPPVACKRATPVLTLSGPTGPAPAGTTRQYTLGVTSGDQPGCAPATYTLAPVMPAGWSGSPAATTTRLAPGGHASATFAIGAPVGAASGEYLVGGSVLSNATGLHGATARTSWTIAATPPPAGTMAD